MFRIKAKLIYNQRIRNNYFCLAFKAPQVARLACPGQFFEVKLSSGLEPLLRKPFSIHRVKRQGLKAEAIEILYEVVGEGTELLSRKKSGEYLDILGPLGRGFSILDSRSSVLVGGGIGIAPLLFLAEKIKMRNSESRILVLIGAKTKKEILGKKEFKHLGGEVKISTDDGSEGFKGKVSQLLNNLLSSLNSQATTIYACGPKPMLKEIALLSCRYNIKAQVSLDEYMACGFGVCLGCAVKTVSGYKMVCKDGPVFSAGDIVW
jgi:dihydroorotate dehydrogenase electron transfer subunit